MIVRVRFLMLFLDQKVHRLPIAYHEIEMFGLWRGRDAKENVVRYFRPHCLVGSMQKCGLALGEKP